MSNNRDNQNPQVHSGSINKHFVAQSYRATKKGYRTIGSKKYFFKSAWEANYARILQLKKERGEIIEWEFEPQVFWFNKIKRGIRSYLPDFRITNINKTQEYHEVKGYINATSKTKIKRMRIYYPNTTLRIIDSKKYKELMRDWSPIIGSEWEF